MNYEKDHSHRHCWEQKPPSACGIAITHACCLCLTPQQTLEERFKGYFEANLLDGDSINDCGKAMLDAKDVYETLLPKVTQIDQEAYERGKKDAIGNPLFVTSENGNINLSETVRMAKQEERNRILGLIEEERIKSTDDNGIVYTPMFVAGCGDVNSYNQALDDLKNLIIKK